MRYDCDCDALLYLVEQRVMPVTQATIHASTGGWREMKYVVDTSVVISGRVTEMLESGEIKGTIIVPEAVMAELEAQANFGKMTGFQGLAEIEKIVKLAKERGFEVIFAGERPKLEHIRLAKGGEIDNLIREVAAEFDAVLITSDRFSISLRGQRAWRPST